MTVNDHPWGRRAATLRSQNASVGFLPLVVLLDILAGVSCLLLAPIFVTNNNLNLGYTWTIMSVWVVAMVFAGAFASGTNLVPSMLITIHAWTLSSAAILLLGFLPAGLEPLKLPLAMVTIVSTVDVLSRLLLARTHTTRIVELVPVDVTDRPDHPAGAFVTRLQLTLDIVSNPSELLCVVTETVIEANAGIVEVPVDAGIPAQVIRNLSWQLREKNVQIRMVVLNQKIRSSRLKTTIQQGRAIVQIAAPRPSMLVTWGKRGLDVFGSGLLIVVLSPAMLVLATLVRLTSKGPVIYRQERVGLDGQPFNILKFRSMVADADLSLAALLDEQGRGNTPLFKVKSDPRITPIGKVMRKYSLDELPQLFNVFSGSMSLVGPRPQRAEEVALYEDEHSQRLGVLPGMTGMWQVSGRSRLSWEEAIELDIYYAHNWTLSTDLSILFRTFKAVIRGDGAE